MVKSAASISRLVDSGLSEPWVARRELEKELTEEKGKVNINSQKNHRLVGARLETEFSDRPPVLRKAEERSAHRASDISLER